VLAALVGRAVLAHRDAAVGGADLDVEAGVGDGVEDLLIGAGGGEHGKAGHKGDQPHGGQAGGHAHHVGLGDAAVKKALGGHFLEHGGTGGDRQVGVQHHQLGVFGGQRLQGSAVAVAGRDVFHFCHKSALLLFQFGQGGVQLVHGGAVVGVAGGFAVPVGIVLHIADALALGGVQDDEGGAALLGVERVHGGLDLVEVVAIDGQHLEAEGLQLLILGGAV